MRAALLLGVLGLTACATTRVTDAWRDPGLGRMKLDRVVVVAMMPDETMRRSAEDVMVAHLRARGIQAVPGYELMPAEGPQDVPHLQAALADQPFDGALTLRIIGIEEQANYVPPSPSIGFWGYYDVGYPWYADPGYVYTDTYVRVETNLYSLEPDKLLWSAITETIDPDSATELSNEVAEEVGEDLEDLGVLPAG